MSDRLYYIIVNKNKLGPLTFDDVIKEDISSETLVWVKGMNDWGKVKDFSEFNEYLLNSPPTLKKSGLNSFKVKHISIKILLVLFGLFLTSLFSYHYYNKSKGESLYNEGLNTYKVSNRYDTIIFQEAINRNNTKSEYFMGAYYLNNGDTLNAFSHFNKALGQGGEFGLWLIEKSAEKRQKYFHDFENYFLSADDSEKWFNEFRMAILYYVDENNYNHNLNLAIKHLENSSNLGYGFVSLKLADHYLLKEYKDEPKALSYYLKSLESGFEYSEIERIYVRLGILYHSPGVDSIKNYKESVKFFTKAGEKNKKLFSYLGYLYHEGVAVPKDEEKAFQYFKISSEHGSDDGKLNLAIYYHDGIGTTPDIKESQRLINELLEKDYPDAIKLNNHLIKERKLKEELANNQNGNPRNKNTDSEVKHQCNYCRKFFYGKGYYLALTRNGFVLNRSNDDNQELCCSSECAYKIMGGY